MTANPQPLDVQKTRNNVDGNGVNYVSDQLNGTVYRLGQLLGKGGFAKCYSLLNTQTNKVFAGKVIAKTCLSKPSQTQKIKNEVDIHQSLRHENIVAFHGFFEDTDNMYIVLELCSRKSLVEVVRARGKLTEPEVRYFLCQIVSACKHMHAQHVLHRDLKLGNMLLSADMKVKVADFGLAVRLSGERERKVSICGTPNYIAPEVLLKVCHSYEADVWALGCIVYALLCGRPPFESTTVEETYSNIIANDYKIPSYVSPQACDLITQILSPKPELRPTLDQILCFEFMVVGFIPDHLTPSCCQKAPVFPAVDMSTGERSQSIEQQKAGSDEPSHCASVEPSSKGIKRSASQILFTCSEMTLEYNNNAKNVKSLFSCNDVHSRTPSTVEHDSLGTLLRLHRVISTCLMSSSSSNMLMPVKDCQAVMVIRWVDYTNIYGFGFQLSDGSIGMVFNDKTQIILFPQTDTVHLLQIDRQISTFTVNLVPDDHRKKLLMLLCFRSYMEQHLSDALDMNGSDWETSTEYACRQPSDGVIYLRRWLRTDDGIIMQLSNGTTQVNIFEDHSKIVLSASEESQDFIATCITRDENRLSSVSYRCSDLQLSGCEGHLVPRLHIVQYLLKKLIGSESRDI